ncbi:MAG: hypothetical protein NZ516_11385, partial [Raineya sp.]|nr:hypothetical protein [Raineya sp.]
FLQKLKTILEKYTSENKTFIGIWSKNYEVSNIVASPLPASYLKTYPNTYRIEIFVPLYYEEKIKHAFDTSFNFFFNSKPLVNYFRKNNCKFDDIKCILAFMKEQNIHLILIEQMSNVPLEFQKYLTVIAKDKKSGTILAKVNY